MKTTRMNFLEALHAAKKGYEIKRACWTGTDNNVFHFPSARSCLENQHGQFFQPHLDDMLAEDWMIVLKPIKTMTWPEIFVKLKEGKKVRRNSWANIDFYIIIDPSNCILSGNLPGAFQEYKPYTFKSYDFDATDWVEV